jgi:hypothetical protein
LGEDHLSIHAPHPIPPICGDTLLKNSLPTFFSGQIQLRLFKSFMKFHGCHLWVNVRNIEMLRSSGRERREDDPLKNYGNSQVDLVGGGARKMIHWKTMESLKLVVHPSSHCYLTC